MAGIKNYWLILLVILSLVVPTFQQVFKLVKVYELSGVYEKFEAPTLNLEQWNNKGFQDQFEKHYNQNFGFRPIFVRARNELDWRIFKEINAWKVLAGKDDFLFERGYLYSYNGEDFVGDSAMEVKNATLRAADEVL